VLVEASGDTQVVLLLNEARKERELFRSSASQAGGISPDGQLYAFVVPTRTAPTNQMRFLRLNGTVEREITIREAANVVTLDWSADGRSLYLGAYMPDASGLALLSASVADGRSSKLWQQTASPWTYAIPSPDGRMLAILSGSMDRNVWMIERF
jgi:hypothetical protein